MSIFSHNTEGIPTEGTYGYTPYFHMKPNSPSPTLSPWGAQEPFLPAMGAFASKGRHSFAAHGWLLQPPKLALPEKKTQTNQGMLWRFTQDKDDGPKQRFKGRYIPCGFSAESISTEVLKGSGISEEKQEASCARKTSISCMAGTRLPRLPQRGAAGF